jgi:hypothetical protein
MEKLQRLSNEQLMFQDINVIEDFSHLPGKHALMNKLHVKTSDDHWLVGLEANVAAWQFTSFGWLCKFLLLKPIKPLANKAYQLWLGYYQKKIV